MATGANPPKEPVRTQTDLASLVSKSWQMPDQAEQAQELKRSFGQVLNKLSTYRRLLINYRNGSDVVLLYLDDWNKIVEQHQALEGRLETLEDLLEELEMAPDIIRRSERSSQDPQRLLGLDDFMAGVRDERP